MKLLDLFTGTGSIAKVARDLGYEVVSLDIDSKCNATICADITEFDYQSETFSCARKCNIGREVNGEMMTPETLARDVNEIGVPILRRTQELIKYLKPKAYFIENPYTGRMKEFIPEKPMIFDYCMFGFDYRKRTAIWTNINVESKMCDKSHLLNGRHKMTAIGSSKTQAGQGGSRSKGGRYSVPEPLIRYLLAEHYMK